MDCCVIVVGEKVRCEVGRWNGCEKLDVARHDLTMIGLLSSAKSFKNPLEAVLQLGVRCEGRMIE